MNKYYTDERNAQIVLSLLKEHSISKVVASPGTTNMSIVASMQQDPYFEMYSSVDERSAAYIACGLATESGDPVVLSCTGATASRNYLPGLTEAYYRKLPILAITSTPPISKIGHHFAQIIDRSNIPNDVAKLSVTLPIVKDDTDVWDSEIKVNRAILELTRHGGGPVHINLPTTYNPTYSMKNLPKYRMINRITSLDIFPDLPHGKIAVLVGAHKKWTKEEEETLDDFCASNDAVVFCDHTSNYKGKYRVLYSLVAGQQMFDHEMNRPDILIHIGEITGDYYSIKNIGKQVWRVSEDGEIRDTFYHLRYVFEMPERIFFKHYIKGNSSNKNNYLQSSKIKLNDLYSKIPELPFSNIWIASQIASQIPENSTIHFGILNSLRSWNFYELPHSVLSSSNVGGFGIDGNLSTIIGASLADRSKLYFAIIGDLAFFYDMNSMGNRHISNNLRIMVVNNGKGIEFRQFGHIAEQFGKDADAYIAAAGHFGNQSPDLVKHYAQDLGFEYLSAKDKQEFASNWQRFLTPSITQSSMLFEIFTNNADESEALETILNIEENMKGKTKLFMKQILGQKGVNMIKTVIRK
jgi:2-succinyl-5-enolpyruvyl-6-hydroxy-3-cyclohexene-1-carboxylate synthase